MVGHGSTVNDGSSAPVYQHAAALRSQKRFAEVREAFWKQEPKIQSVVDRLARPVVFIVPLFISGGYFSEQIIPRALGFELAANRPQSRILRHGAQELVYCRPVGSHGGITEVLLARATGIVQQFPFPRAPSPMETTLFIAGHGTEEDENSRKAIERQVELIRARGLYADVQAVFMEEEPRIAECYRLARTRNLIVVPFFISEGMHVTEDIPVLLGEPERLVRQRARQGQTTWPNPSEKHGKRVWYTRSVGSAPQITNVILERVKEAEAWEPLRSAPPVPDA